MIKSLSKSMIVAACFLTVANVNAQNGLKVEAPVSALEFFAKLKIKVVIANEAKRNVAICVQNAH